MATTHVEERDEFGLLEEFERDLPSVACRAAIELHNLLRNGGRRLRALATLVSDIEDSFGALTEPTARASMLDPTTAVVMNGAIHETISQENLETVRDLAERVMVVTEDLKALLAEPRGFTNSRPDRVVKLRDFCLAISKHASGFEPSPHDVKPKHPFRS
jgi:hypothetical protein